MAVPTTPLQRLDFYVRHRQGETYEQIARHYGLSKECVRYWCRRQRDGGSYLTTYHRPPSGALAHFHPLVRYAILRLRLEHPRWGPGRIRAKLSGRPSLRGKALPSQASIGRYLRCWPRFRRAVKARVKRQRPASPTQVHQRWEVDFKLELALADGSKVNLMTVYDPVAGACLGAWVFPAPLAAQRGERVSLQQLQTGLRLCFARWQTLPLEIQTDNESVFVGKCGDSLPSPFTLWLAGLGIKHLLIRPGHPTDNAGVERAHQVLYFYVILRRQAWLNRLEMQQALDRAIEELAFDLPSQAADCRGRPPAEAHPELCRSARPFQPEWELSLFDLEQVDRCLSTVTCQRRVNKAGQVSLGGRHEYYSVGRSYANQEVLVRFDPCGREFVFYSVATPETEIGRQPARHLTVAELTGLVPWPTSLGPQQLPLPWNVKIGVSC